MKRVPQIVLALLASLLAACQTPGFDDRALKKATVAAPEDVDGIRLTPITAASLHASPSARAQLPIDSPAAPYEYRVGAGDVLSVLVWDHPELSDVELTFDDRPASLSPGTGRTVGADGTIYFPFVGDLAVAGHTAREVRNSLTQGLATYLKAPQVEVRISAYRSQRVVVSGAVRAPGVVALGEVQLSIFDVLAQAGGTLAEADLTAVTVVRDTHIYVFDVASLQALRADEVVTIRPGDLVNVPDSSAKRVHVLGEVRHSGSYPMQHGRMSLADALGAGGGFDPLSADPGRIYVFRNEQGDVTAHWLDAASPTAMALAADYPLQPQDVVYVAPVSFTRYNRALGQFLPTLQALWQTAITSRELRR